MLYTILLKAYKSYHNLRSSQLHARYYTKVKTILFISHKYIYTNIDCVIVKSVGKLDLILNVKAVQILDRIF